jgi:hypothetical protein
MTKNAAEKLIKIILELLNELGRGFDYGYEVFKPD